MRDLSHSKNLKSEKMTFAEYARRTGAIWLSPKIVAKLMQCSIEHVYDLAKSGRVPYIRDGRNIRFRPEDLDAYEERIYGIHPKKPRRRAHGPFQEARE